MSDERCEICKFFRPNKLHPSGHGECRRYSPTAHQLIMPAPQSVLAGPSAPPQMQVVYQGTFPPVSKEQWCGEFAGKLNG